MGKNPTWDRSSKKQKTSYVQSLVASQGNMDEFHKIQASLCPICESANDGHSNCQRGNYANNDCQGYGLPGERMNSDPPGDCRYYGPHHDRDRNDAFTYPCIPVFNQAFDGHQPLPVPIDADLPHFVIKIGDSGTTPTPSLTPCVDTEAGANVGYIGYFYGILSMHPECVDKKLCVNNGEYSSIHMTGIVSKDTTGITSTDFPIAVQLRTPYRNCNGHLIFITVALENSVSINFILSNDWLKKLGATIDYVTDRLLVNFQDHGGFPLTYRRSAHTMVDASTRKPRKYFKDVMPVMTSLSSVISIYNPVSKWHPHVQSVIDHYQATTLKTTIVPAPMPPSCALRTSDPTLSGRFTPARRLATLALSPGHSSQIQCTAKTNASRSALVVSFNIDGHTSPIIGTSVTHGQLIEHGDPNSSSNYAEDYDDTDLFKTNEEERVTLAEVSTIIILSRSATYLTICPSTS